MSIKPCIYTYIDILYLNTVSIVSKREFLLMSPILIHYHMIDLPVLHGFRFVFDK